MEVGAKRSSIVHLCLHAVDTSLNVLLHKFHLLDLFIYIQHAEINLVDAFAQPEKTVQLSSSSTKVTAMLPTADKNPAPPTEEVLRAIDAEPQIPAPIHVEVSRETLCLFTQILFDQTSEAAIINPQLPFSVTHFFRILFRFVISPNAP